MPCRRTCIPCGSKHGGFKTYQQTGIVLTANGRFELGNVPLQLGSVTETISVEAQTAALQTDSSEQSAELSNRQLENLTARGRDVVSLLRTIPGVSSTHSEPRTGWFDGWNGLVCRSLSHPLNHARSGSTEPSAWTPL
ncbi:MAG TPA: hypothetical protein VGL97_14270 [Bryobacteraceae bacterium]